MIRLIGKIYASEKDYTDHVFEIYRTFTGSAAPYIVMKDGEYMADGESMRQAIDEIEDAIKWFGWKLMVKNLLI